MSGLWDVFPRNVVIAQEGWALNERVLMAYEAGAPAKVLAGRMGVHKQRIYQRIRRGVWQRGKQTPIEMFLSTPATLPANLGKKARREILKSYLS